jgi:hypothetical protein
MSDEDLKRSREYGDSFRKYLIAATTGGIGVLFATAGSFAEKNIDPRWVVGPTGCFVLALIAIGVALLMGEHRSLMRRRDPNAQAKMPRWKMGITWNLIPLAGFIVGVMWAVAALNAIEFTRCDAKVNSVSTPVELWIGFSA